MLKIEREENQYRVELFQVNKLNTLFAELVHEQLREMVERSGSTVIFNLDGIQFIDSEGFRVLLDISDRAAAFGSQFKLCNVNNDLKELILLMELEG